jgi:hypothetical protein
VPTELRFSNTSKRYVGDTGLDGSRHTTAWDVEAATLPAGAGASASRQGVEATRRFIPVVTFLAPLASGSEGLKDR